MAELCDSVAFLDANYEEALGLAVETRDYLSGRPGGEGPPLQRMALSCAALRVTSRLTQVMAWLMVQRAVQAGEISRAAATGEPYRLGGQDICLDPGPLPDEPLPPAFAQIYDRSRQLYVRVARLDAMMDGPRLAGFRAD